MTMTHNQGIATMAAKRMKSIILDRQHHTLKKSTRVSIICLLGTKNYKQDNIWMTMHRYPRWMGLKVHMVLETVIRRLPKTGRLSGLETIIHGWICDYNMKEMIKYMKNETHYRHS